MGGGATFGRSRFIWNTTAVETNPARIAVEGHVDVAIVGGGFTGLSTALHCVEKGFHVTFLKPVKLGLVGRGVMLV